MRRAESRPSGFTLVEVLVALGLSAVVVLGARLLLENLGGAAERVSRTARNTDSDANGERLLRALVGRLELGTQRTATFGGDERETRFSSWCDASRGWQERCRVTLDVELSDALPVLFARASTGEAVAVVRARHFLALRYLADPAQGGTWFVRWGDGLTVPRAIGVIVDTDTLIVRIGERG